MLLSMMAKLPSEALEEDQKSRYTPEMEMGHLQ